MLSKDICEDVMRLLKTHETRLLILRTPLGDLEAKRTKGEEGIIYTLDSVPIDKELQKELSKLWGTN